MYVSHCVRKQNHNLPAACVLSRCSYIPNIVVRPLYVQIHPHGRALYQNEDSIIWHAHDATRDAISSLIHIIVIPPPFTKYGVDWGSFEFAPRQESRICQVISTTAYKTHSLLFISADCLNPLCLTDLCKLKLEACMQWRQEFPGTHMTVGMTSTCLLNYSIPKYSGPEVVIQVSTGRGPLATHTHTGMSPTMHFLL